MLRKDTRGRSHARRSDYTGYEERKQHDALLDKHGISCPDGECPELLSQCIDAGDRDNR